MSNDPRQIRYRSRRPASGMNETDTKSRNGKEGGLDTLGASFDVKLKLTKSQRCEKENKKKSFRFSYCG